MQVAPECLSETMLVAFADGRLVDGQRQVVTAHIDACTECLALLAEVARRETEHGPAEAEPEQEPEPEPRWSPPLELEEYRLLAPIGRGASGQVWRAHDTRLDRLVAIKFLSAPSRQVARDRFELEARAIARLSHPNVVTVHRVGAIDGRPFLVSELVRGQSLVHLTTPLPWRRALELGIGLARGMAAAHAAGVLHRDIKPANAILADTGEVKLVDFGLAKLLDPVSNGVPAPVAAEGSGPVSLSPTGLTTTGMLLGTPLYMAPEAWQGAAPTARMDVYSLGAVLYELCVGRPPHAGRRIAELRHNVSRYDAAPIELVCPDVDADFARVIMRCVRRAPEERWASGEELCAALEHVAADAGASQAHVLAQAAARARRRGAAIIGAGLVLSLTAVAALVVHDYRDDRARRAHGVERARELGSDPAPELDVRTVVSVDEIEGMWSGDFGKLLIAVDADGHLRGVYLHDEGTVQGRFANGTFDGWWCENDRGRITPNGVPRQAPFNAGPAHFSFLRESDGRLVFDGRWQNGGESLWHEDWDMVKVDQPADPALRARLGRKADYCSPPFPFL